MGLSRVERNIADGQAGDVNSTQHAANYQPADAARQRRVESESARVMMCPKSSDKGEGVASTCEGSLMGQATVDLPDPLEQPPVVSATNTDELLAQLAGEEIDRLLAEADSEAPVAPAGSAASPTATARPVVPEAPAPATSDQKIEGPAKAAAQEGASAPVAVAIPKAVETESAVEAAVSAQLDELFQQLTGGEAGEAVPPAEAAAPTGDVSEAAREVDQAISAGAPAALTALEAELEAVAPAGSADPAAASAEPLDPNASTSAAERTVLDAAGALADAVESGEVGAILEPKPLPAYLKPLEWINAPLEACPDAVRDLIGKIAILTTFNAVALLLYVLLFRRH